MDEMILPQTDGPAPLDESHQTDGNPDLPKPAPLVYAQGQPLPIVEVAKSRAVKADIAMQDKSPGADPLFKELQAGRENRLRDRMAQDLDMRDKLQRYEIIQNIATARQVPLNTNEMDNIMSIQRDSEGRLSIPETALEKKYSRALIKQIAETENVSNMTKNWNMARPEVSQMGWTLASGVLAKREMFQNAHEDARSRRENSSGSQLASHIGRVLLTGGFSDNYDMYNVVPGMKEFENQIPTQTPGANITKAVQLIASMPIDQAKLTLDEITKGMDPWVAEEFTKKVLDYNTALSTSDNFWFGVNFLTLIGGFINPNAGALKNAIPSIGSHGSRLPLLSDVEKKIMQAGASPITADLSRPYFREFQILSDWERDTLRRMPTPMNVDSLSEPGSIGTMVRPRPMSTYEIFRGARGQEARPLDIPETFRPEPLSVGGGPRPDNTLPPGALEKAREGAKGLGRGEGGRFLGNSTSEPYNRDAVQFRPTFNEQGVQPGLTDKYNAQNPQLRSEPIEPRVAPKDVKPALLDSWKQVVTVMKDVTKAATEDSPPNPSKVLTATGNVQGAARAAVAIAPKGSEKGFRESLQDIFRIDLSLGATNFNREAVVRLQNLWQSQVDKLLGTVDDVVRIQRLTPEGLNAAFKAAEDLARERLQPNANSAVLNVRREYDPQRNTHSAILVLGKKDATLFTEGSDHGWSSAQTTAQLSYRLAPGSYDIIQYGAGHAIALRAPINETDNLVLDAMFATGIKDKVPFVNGLIAHLRGAAYTLSPENMLARNVASHGTARLQEASKEVFDNIAALSKTERRNMNRVFTLDRDYTSNGQIGRFANSLGEFETNYSSIFNRPPSEAEAKAYFSYRALNDFDLALRNLVFYKDLSRLGAEQFRLKVVVAETSTTPSTSKYTEYFLAREAKELPASGQKSVGVFLNTPEYRNKYFRTSNMPVEIRSYIEETLQRNQNRLVQIVNPLERPLHDEVTGHGGDIIHFVVSRDVQSKPLDLNMIPFHPGGHREYTATHYVKQSIISRMGGRFNYEGDNTILGASSNAEARVFADRLNTAASLFKQGRHDELREYLSKNLPEEHFGYDDFVRRFNTKDGRLALSTEEPFQVVPTGKSIYQVDKSMAARYGDQFSNERDSPFNLMQQVNKKFIGSRDNPLWKARDLGTDEQPLVVMEAAHLIDPLVSLNRTVSNAANEYFMSDYKVKAAQEFVERFGYLMTEDPNRMRQNPMYYLHNPPWRSDYSVAAELRTAQAARASVVQFMGMDAPSIKWVKQLEMKAIDFIHDRGFPGTAQWVSEKFFGQINDPVSYARALAFHSKFAYNPRQLINQIQGVVNTWALAGMNGLHGSLAATAGIRLNFTEDVNIMKHYGSLLQKGGSPFTADTFAESNIALRKSGFNLVQGETSWKDDTRDINLIATGFGKFLSAGGWFFREGERFARQAAWHAGYLEWKAANAGRVLDDRGIAEVLERANQLNNYMTKAGMAPIQGGLLSIPTQFWGYQWRLMEQLNPFGKQLTPYEKVRAYSVYGAMYGLPTAIGAGVGIWPMYDSLRQTALEQGLDWNQNGMTKAIFEGLPHYIVYAATGKDLSSKWGPQGQGALRDLIHNGDFTKFITGASGGVIKDITKSLAPVFYGAWKGLTEGNYKFWDSKEFPLVVQDWQDTTQNISVVNESLKTFYAWNFRQYYTRSGVPVADMDKMDAALYTAFGVPPRSVGDWFLKSDSLKQTKAHQDEAMKSIGSEIKRAFEQASKGDADGYDRHMARARSHFIGGGFRDDQWAEVYRKTMSPLQPMTNSIDWDFTIRRAPRDRYERNINNMGK